MSHAGTVIDSKDTHSPRLLAGIQRHLTGITGLHGHITPSSERPLLNPRAIDGGTVPRRSDTQRAVIGSADR